MGRATRRRLADYETMYYDRIDCLSFNGYTQGLSIILAAQFIFFNLHYAIGSTLTVCALLSWSGQIIINAVEYRQLKAQRTEALCRTLDVHFWLNRGFILLYMPFLVWAVVLMYERATSPP